MPKKNLSNLTVLSNSVQGEDFFLLRLKIDDIHPEIRPGQFVEIRIKGADGVLLRRPISIHDYNEDSNIMELLVRKAGNGTKCLARCQSGDKLDVVFPLGNGFDLSMAGERPLLVGGGVGVAPLLMLAKELKKVGATPTFLFGARTSKALLRKDVYQKVANVDVATEDGSEGVKGFVTDHNDLSIEGLKAFSSVMQCGPTPMMKAVAKRAQAAGVPCFASLENMMACGFGVCLCCVTDTVNGNMRVCADGPVFNVNELKW